MDTQLERLMKKLGEAINDSISASRPIADVIDRVKYSGYDVYVVLEVPVGLHKTGEQGRAGAQGSPAAEPELRISRQDERFLESMKISISPKPGRNREKAA